MSRLVFTKHALEYLGVRTKLGATEFQTLWQRKAFVHLGSTSYGYPCYLFWDEEMNKCVVLITARGMFGNEHKVISVWETDYGWKHNRPTEEQQNEAKRLAEESIGVAS